MVLDFLEDLSMGRGIQIILGCGANKDGESSAHFERFRDVKLGKPNLGSTACKDIARASKHRAGYIVNPRYVFVVRRRFFVEKSDAAVCDSDNAHDKMQEQRPVVDTPLVAIYTLEYVPFSALDGRSEERGII